MKREREGDAMAADVEDEEVLMAAAMFERRQRRVTLQGLGPDAASVPILTRFNAVRKRRFRGWGGCTAVRSR